MIHAQMRLWAFAACFGPSLFLMSALPVASVKPPAVLEAVVIGGVGGDDGSPPAASCRGTPLGKGWCPKLKCTSGDCSANWKSIASGRCSSKCAAPAWNCCGWRINTNEDCTCVDSEAEPEGYNCGPCDKKYLIEW